MLKNEAKVRKIIDQILQSKGEKLSDDLSVYIHENGLGFDSLDTATLSALLEQELGIDPYSQGKFPLTVRELVDFYESEQ